MIALIAESKTMQEHQELICPGEFESHRPAGEETADQVMLNVSQMSVDEIAAAVKVSPGMAARISRMAYEFPNKGIGLKAIEAYTGVVFKSLDYFTLTAEEKLTAINRIKIISSLYGWLNADDCIKPYRFDFSTRLAPADRTFSDFWRKDVTIELVKYLKASGETDILHLLPADAAKCIDWKLVKRFAKVWKVDFKQLMDGGEWRTPHAGKLKAMRGELLRQLITLNIDSPEGLLTVATDNLLPLGTPDYPDHFAFCV